MANKQYKSIIRLFEHCGIATGNDLNVSRVKKQLQAEFGVAVNGFIEVDRYSYTRQEVFDEIEHPQFSNRLAFHQQIWASPELLQLLENNSVDLDTIGQAFTPFWGNKDFDEFFSPYFPGPFSYISRTLLVETRLKEMGELLHYEDFLQPAEREEAFRPLRVFLDDNIRLLRNVSGDNYNIMREQIGHWVDADWYLLFNNLPHEFYDIKIDLISKIVNLSVAVQKSHRRDCRQMSEQLILIQDIPESLRGTIESNHAVYTRSSSGKFSWSGGFWIFWIILMVMRAAFSGGCDSNRTSNYQFQPSEIRYQLQDSTWKMIKDSGAKARVDSVLKRMYQLKK